jgi:hypothetical protein
MTQATGRAPSPPAFDFLSIAPEHIRVFHYSKGLSPETPDGEPPIRAILVCDFATGERPRFSRCREAKAPGVTKEESRNPRLLERRALERFFAYLVECGDACWVIWTIRSDFGLDHLAQRLRELGGEPPAKLPRQFSLRGHFKQYYGDNFAPDEPHGQLQSLAAMNDSSLGDWLSQEQAAAAFSKGDDRALDNSLEQKVGWVVSFIRKHRRGELKTAETDSSLGRDRDGSPAVEPADSTGALDPRARAAEPRVSVDLDTSTVILDGQLHKIEDRLTFRIFSALIELHNQRKTPAPRREVAKQAKVSKCDRPERKLKGNLPPELRAIWKSKRGPNGGWWLELPVRP